MRVLRARASPIEKLDALSWVDINALDQFHDEFRIQLAWMRQSPPDTPNPGLAFTTRLRQLRYLLTGDIPTMTETLSVVEDFSMRSQVPQYVFDILRTMPRDTHPMTMFSRNNFV